mmetsp:Transcript_21377/g.59320  ORF Transcript_21377/g.59320 Transcript_21377/m.59320 type:complete len:252 (+) Transcript_21377:1148-1903(+)
MAARLRRVVAAVAAYHGAEGGDALPVDGQLMAGKLRPLQKVCEDLPDHGVVGLQQRVHGALEVAHEAAVQPTLHHGFKGMAPDGRQVAQLRHAGGHGVAAAKVLVIAAHQVEGGHVGVACDASVLRPEVGPVVRLTGVGEDDPPIEDVNKGLVLEGAEDDGTFAGANQEDALTAQGKGQAAQDVGKLCLAQRDDVAVHAVEGLGVAHEGLRLARVHKVAGARGVLGIEGGLAPVVGGNSVQQHAGLGLPSA